MPNNLDNLNPRSSEAIVKDLHVALVEYTDRVPPKQKHELLLKAHTLSEELQHSMYSSNDKINNLFAIKSCAMEVIENDILSSPKKGA